MLLKQWFFLDAKAISENDHKVVIFVIIHDDITVSYRFSSASKLSPKIESTIHGKVNNESWPIALKVLLAELKNKEFTTH